MIYPHVIRLRGPWHFEVLPVGGAVAASQLSATDLACRDDAPTSGSLPLPADWISGVPASLHSRVCWRRRFSRPSGLDEGEAVWLCIAGRGAMLTVALNERPLAAIDASEPLRAIDVTNLLQPRNELTIEAHRPGGPCPELQVARGDANVRLEIRRAAEQ